MFAASPTAGILSLVLVFGVAATSAAAESPAEKVSNRSAAPAAAPPIKWMDDYARAVEKARSEQKMLLIFFAKDTSDAVRRWFEYHCNALQPELRKNHVWARLPLDATILIDGQSQRLLDHAAFSYMYNRQGAAVIDYAHPEESFYGRAVTMLPFEQRSFYTAHAVRTLVQLPAGTLTQRSMIFAVRIHPESPRSTTGKSHRALLEEARSHSSHQASIGVQGHHNWDSRFHRINARLGGGAPAKEVVAESWPGETLMEACVDCVDCWRQSSGHWSAVRSYHACYGYDIRYGRNGIWYATGIFGGR